MENRSWLFRWALVGLGVTFLGLPVMLAQGGPPMLTDDPGTPGDKHWEVNVASTFNHSPNGEQSLGLPLVDINYGVGDHLQLKYEGPMLLGREPGEAATSGYGNPEFGVKWRFVDEDKSGLDISTYPQYSLNNASSAQKGLVDPGSSFLLPLEFHGKLVGEMEWNVEFGRNFHSRLDDTWLYGLAIGQELSKSFEFALEFHGEGKFSGSDELIGNLGGRLKLTEHQTLLISAGRSLNRLHGDEFDFVGYLGMQFTY
jgi:hypothetical protein